MLFVVFVIWRNPFGLFGMDGGVIGSDIQILCSQYSILRRALDRIIPFQRHHAEVKELLAHVMLGNICGSP